MAIPLPPAQILLSQTPVQNYQLTKLIVQRSELLLVYDWRFTANQFVLATSPSRLSTSKFFQLNTCSHSPYVISSLTRGWNYRLQLLLVLASAVILRSESRGFHYHILLSDIRDSPNLRFGFPNLYTPGTGWPSFSHTHCVPFLSPPTTCSATVEVFDPVSTQDWLSSKLHLAYNLSARTT
jgi:hypothetical protein